MQLCDRLAWDSEFFGIPIARIRPTRLDDGLVTQIEAWADAEGIRCLYLLADLDDAATVRIAEQREFRLVDVRVTYEIATRDVVRVVDPARMRGVRDAVPEDIAPLRAIATSSFRHSRFYQDPGFPDARCDELYATWIERSVHGYADRVFVVGPPGDAYGFMTVHRHGRVGISAVRDDRRGRGDGLALYQAAVDWHVAEGIDPSVWAMQAANIRGQRLVQRFGGRISHVALWYHRWLTRG